MNGGSAEPGGPGRDSSPDDVGRSDARASVSRRSLLKAGGAVGGVLALSPVVWQLTGDDAPDPTGGAGDGTSDGPDGEGPGTDATGGDETDGGDRDDGTGDGDGTDDRDGTDDGDDATGEGGYGRQGYGEGGYGG